MGDIATTWPLPPPPLPSRVASGSSPVVYCNVSAKKTFGNGLSQCFDNGSCTYIMQHGPGSAP